MEETGRAEPHTHCSLARCINEPVKGAVSGGSRSFSTKREPFCDARRLFLLKEKGFREGGKESVLTMTSGTMLDTCFIASSSQLRSWPGLILWKSF